MIYIGIDPGLTGAIAVYKYPTGPGLRIEFFDTPTVVIKSGKKNRKQMNIPAIKIILDEIMARYDTQIVAVIEKVNAMPGKPSKALEEQGEESQAMGVTSAFNFGKGYGIWLGLLSGLEIPFQEVHPATWKAKMMRDCGKEKDASRVKAMQLFPSAAKDLALKKHHNRADALLMAAYGWKSELVPVNVEEKEPALSLF